MLDRWTVYVARCRGGSLYTGIAKDVKARMAVHNAGKGGAYTRSHRPVRLAYREDGYTLSQALKREIALKRLTAAAKRVLIKAFPLKSAAFKVKCVNGSS